ncbi:MAG: 16S rRNA (guanine(966)-N(2))-methyltransferase RsmD [Candidatus Omnitrophica bacterium]|nr:16S rRNA (guanine(966)-N(2))-methyltransferase RsmD [Candidatus Omnitrophota bacterium]
MVIKRRKIAKRDQPVDDTPTEAEKREIYKTKMKIKTSVSGGEFRGRNIYMPAHIRPTQNVTRKAIFDLLGHDLTGLTFLELFAGSGAIGIEALSRGAEKVTFVEKDEKCLDVIRQNLGLLNLEFNSKNGWSYEIVEGDALFTSKEFSRKNCKFDIVFIDPPYGMDLGKKSLKTLNAYDILHPTSTLVIQHEVDEILPEKLGRFCIFKHKIYGKTAVDIFNVGPYVGDVDA